MAFELPPPPSGQLIESWQWRDWFFRLREAVLAGIEGEGGPGQGLVSPGGGSPPEWVTIYFTQSFVNAVQINVTHSMGINPLVQVFTTAGEMIIPKRIQHLTINTLVVKFSVPVSGKIIAIR